MKLFLTTFFIFSLVFNLFSQKEISLKLRGDVQYYSYDPTTFEVYENGVKIGNFDNTGNYVFFGSHKRAFIIKHPDFSEDTITSHDLHLSKNFRFALVRTKLTEEAKKKLYDNLKREQTETCTGSIKSELELKYKDVTFDSIASFPGGLDELKRYLSSNIRYPQKSHMDSIQGKVYFTFIIEEDGSVTCITIDKGVDYLIDKEAFRCVKNLPRFKPAKLNGRAIPSVYRIPIIFKLD